MWVLGTTLGVLQEQQGLLTAAPSLAAHKYSFTQWLQRSVPALPPRLWTYGTSVSVLNHHGLLKGL